MPAAAGHLQHRRLQPGRPACPPLPVWGQAHLHDSHLQDHLGPQDGLESGGAAQPLPGPRRVQNLARVQLVEQLQEASQGQEPGRGRGKVGRSRTVSRPARRAAAAAAAAGRRHEPHTSSALRSGTPRQASACLHEDKGVEHQCVVLAGAFDSRVVCRACAGASAAGMGRAQAPHTRPAGACARRGAPLRHTCPLRRRVPGTTWAGGQAAAGAPGMPSSAGAWKIRAYMTASW